ncbi:MAG: hypothetical protein MZV70_57735 [Desulfobacterales bacterium]|nr:hypothetical protein [Desulfobacterales bacterium]
MTTSDNRPAKFAEHSRYVLDDELAKIVNISMALEMPLLLKGEPGTGKTMLRARYRGKLAHAAYYSECQIQHETDRRPVSV